ncbi:hypothetical protein EMIT079MI2_50170 [Bacillus sp. IT-79MI2]
MNKISRPLNLKRAKPYATKEDDINCPIVENTVTTIEFHKKVLNG